MKNLNSILQILTEQSEFKRLTINAQINKLIETLPNNIKRGIKLGYIKNGNLCFILTHPVFKVEFNYSKSLVKSIAIEKGFDIKDIQVFVSNTIDRKKEKEKELFFPERSKGNFVNKAKDENLFKRFEKIKESIKSKI